MCNRSVLHLTVKLLTSGKLHVRYYSMLDSQVPVMVAACLIVTCLFCTLLWSVVKRTLLSSSGHQKLVLTSYRGSLTPAGCRCFMLFRRYMSKVMERVNILNDMTLHVALVLLVLFALSCARAQCVCCKQLCMHWCYIVLCVKIYLRWQ